MRSIIPIVAVAAITAAAIAPSTAAAQAGPASCDQLLPPVRVVKSQKVGPSSCLMKGDRLTVDGQAFTCVEIGLDGTVDGYLTKTGDYRGYFTNSPELAFPQTDDPGPVFFGIASYGHETGASMAIIFPAAERDAGAGDTNVIHAARRRATWTATGLVSLTPGAPVSEHARIPGPAASRSSRRSRPVCRFDRGTR